MSEHRATITWTLSGGDFAAGRYSRAHALDFEGGVDVVGTASAAVVGTEFARADGVDPEAMFTAAVSACHMLWFLDLARRAGFVVASYRDEAVGKLERTEAAKMAMTRVVLRPRIAFEDTAPSPAALAALHAAAHEACYIANSITTQVVVEPAA